MDPEPGARTRGPAARSSRRLLLANIGRELVGGDGSAARLEHLFELVGGALGLECYLHYQPIARRRADARNGAGFSAPMLDGVRDPSSSVSRSAVALRCAANGSSSKIST